MGEQRAERREKRTEEEESENLRGRDRKDPDAGG